jgi:hypothetical protein
MDGLGRFTKIGAALLIMGIVGGAILHHYTVSFQKPSIQNKRDTG